MPEYRFFQPIDVRYGDLDPQRHVNNARYFTYMEQARAGYLRRLGLWDGADFDAIGIILVEASCTFRAPITSGRPVQVGVQTVRLGTKSLETAYSIRDVETKLEFATGKAVLVAYDYRRNVSIPLPESWREAIRAFEGLLDA